LPIVAASGELHHAKLLLVGRVGSAVNCFGVVGGVGSGITPHRHAVGNNVSRTDSNRSTPYADHDSMMKVLTVMSDV
jgi:hypothetical protein